VPPRIAVFNHSPTNLRLFQEILSKRGYEVLTFQQEMTTMAEVELAKPDLIILAYIVGYQENELEIINELRSMPATHRIPIIVCSTGARKIEDIAHYINIHYISLLPKPFNMNELVALVAQSLSSNGSGEDVSK
jgi:DNA-binding response OmpR family regulator